MARNVTVSLNENSYRIWRDVPHGNRSALFENLLTKWADQYERDKYTGEVVQPKSKDSLDELDAKVDAYVVRHTRK